MFIPKRIIVEKDAIKYQLTKDILKEFEHREDTEVIQLNTSQNKFKQHIPGEDLHTWYKESKSTLVIGPKKGMKFQTCKPSAHYQIPLISGCMGQCEYCYLNTMLGDRPYVKVNVNLEEILNQAQAYIEQRLPDITIFEGAATSDPVPVEPYTHSLKKAIEFFGNHEYGRFRFVTKYSDIDSLLNLDHKGHTEIRFSINTESVINNYEHATASCSARIDASMKVARAGYPMGYLIAPVFIYDDWKQEYHDLLKELRDKQPTNLTHPITFEIISHRYTTIAKNRINQVFPESTLPMNEEERQFKYGQFGYGKYVYPKESIHEIKQFFTEEINTLFQNTEVKYII